MTLAQNFPSIFVPYENFDQSRNIMFIVGYDQGI